MFDASRIVVDSQSSRLLRWRARILEGCSIRSTERMTGVHRDTICRLLVRVGNGCANLLDERMVNLETKRLELDEIWSFIDKKQRQVQPTDDRTLGDTWTYVAIDAESKLIPSFFVGKRDAANTNVFVADLAARLRNRVPASRFRRMAYAYTSNPSATRSAPMSTTRRS